MLVAFGAKAVLAAKGATTTIPIVDPAIGAPVALGLTGSLARPSGNITGLTSFGAEVAAKRLELLKEASSNSTSVAVLLNPANASGRVYFQSMQNAAKSLKLEVRAFEVLTPLEFEATFQAIAARRMNAVAILTDTLFRSNANVIADLAAKRRLPSVGSKEFAEAGGLIGYGGNDEEMYRRAAVFVDKLLRGAKPTDLPIEGVTKFELVVNAKTAREIGLAVPQSLLLRADKVVE